MWPSACFPCNHLHMVLMVEIGDPASSHQETSDRSCCEDLGADRERPTPSSQTTLQKRRPQQLRTDQIAPFGGEVWHAVASREKTARCQQTLKPWRHPETFRSSGRRSLFSEVGRTDPSCGLCHYHMRRVFRGSALQLGASLGDQVLGHSLGFVEVEWAWSSWSIEGEVWRCCSSSCPSCP